MDRPFLELSKCQKFQNLKLVHKAGSISKGKYHGVSGIFG